jgi:hypothetical protein
MISGSAEEANWRDSCRQVLNIILWVGQLVPSLIQVSRHGHEVEQVFALGGPLSSLLQPANYAFVVWLPLYVGTFAFVVVGGLPSFASDPLFRKTGWSACLTWFLLAVWTLLATINTEPQASRAQFSLTCVLFATVLASAWTLAAIVAHGERFSDIHLLAVVAPLSGLTGWLLVASLVNLCAWLLTLHVEALSYSSSDSLFLPAASICVFGCIGIGLSWVTRGNPYLLFTYAWGVIGTAVANARPGYHPLQLVACINVSLIVLVTVWLWWLFPSTAVAKWGLPALAGQGCACFGSANTLLGICSRCENMRCHCGALGEGTPLLSAVTHRSVSSHSARLGAGYGRSGPWVAPGEIDPTGSFVRLKIVRATGLGLSAGASIPRQLSLHAAGNLGAVRFRSPPAANGTDPECQYKVTLQLNADDCSACFGV